MSDEVKTVTDVAKQIVEVKERAKAVAADLRKNIDEVHQSLAVAEDLSTALRDAGVELRGVLGTQTNNPPKSVTEENNK